jgi:hypothetical protein
MICDFCSAENPQWVCPCATYEVEPGVQSRSDWMACDICAQFICHRVWNGLATRGLKTTSGIMLEAIMGRNRALREIMRLHDGYRQHATGEPRPLVKGAG